MFWVVLAGRAKWGDSKALNTFACISSFNREESHHLAGAQCENPPVNKRTLLAHQGTCLNHRPAVWLLRGLGKLTRVLTLIVIWCDHVCKSSDFTHMWICWRLFIKTVIFMKRYEEGSYEGEINEAKNPEGQVGGELVSSHETCSKILCCELASMMWPGHIWVPEPVSIISAALHHYMWCSLT